MRDTSVHAASARGRQPGLCPEAELLLCVASPMEETERLARLRSLTAQELDWGLLLEAGSHNEMLALLYWHLRAGCPDQVPPLVLEDLRRFFGQTTVRNLALTRELMMLLEALEREGVEAVPFKGPPLAQLLYGNLALRSAVDLDILVRRSDLARAQEVLLAAEFHLVGDLSDEQQRAHLDSHYHFEFHREKGDIEVELHWDLLPKHCGNFDTSYVWNHLTTVTLAGRSVRSLPPEELFVLLCIHHGSKHQWKCLKWIADIGRMIAAYEYLDWSGVMSRARSLEQERAVLMGCFLAESLLGVELPVQIRSALRGDVSLRAQAALIRGRLFRPGHGLPGFREWCAYFDADGDSDLEGGTPLVRYVQYFSTVMTPEWGDRYDLRLPGSLSFLHYMYRPARLLAEHGTALFKRLN
jgi:Uncharacterised nucleotidyltransferase